MILVLLFHFALLLAHRYEQLIPSLQERDEGVDRPSKEEGGSQADRNKTREEEDEMRWERGNVEQRELEVVVEMQVFADGFGVGMCCKVEQLSKSPYLSQHSHDIS